MLRCLAYDRQIGSVLAGLVLPIRESAQDEPDQTCVVLQVGHGLVFFGQHKRRFLTGVAHDVVALSIAGERIPNALVA